MKKLGNLLAACIVSVLASLGAVYALAPIIPTIPFTFISGTVANPTQVNTNFSTFQANINAFQTGGTWTPTDNSGGSLTFVGSSAGFTQIGNMVFAYAQVIYPVTADTHNASIAGLPVISPASGADQQCFVGYTSNGLPSALKLVPSTANINLFAQGSGQLINSQISGVTVNFECIYPAS